MKSQLAKILVEMFPDLVFKEEFFSSKAYCIDIRVANCFVVVQVTSETNYGISVVEDNELDFSGHDQIANSLDETVELVAKQITDLLDS